MLKSEIEIYVALSFSPEIVKRPTARDQGDLPLAFLFEIRLAWTGFILKIV